MYAKTLSMLINKWMESRIGPDLLKLGKILPIYKAKDKQQLPNYHQILLLPSMLKILEKCIHNRLYKFICVQSTFLD